MSIMLESYTLRNEKSYSFRFTSPIAKHIFVTITTYSDSCGKMRFIASGNIHYLNDSKVVVGQCLPEIKQIVNDKTFDKIYYLWEMYHSTNKPVSFKDRITIKQLWLLSALRKEV